MCDIYDILYTYIREEEETIKRRQVTAREGDAALFAHASLHYDAARLSMGHPTRHSFAVALLCRNALCSLCTGERIHEDSALDGGQRRVPDIYPYHANRFSQGREIGSSIANYANTMDSVASGREYLV